MKKFSKILAVILAVCMIGAALSACNATIQQMKWSGCLRV